MEREKVKQEFLAVIQPFTRKTSAGEITDDTLLVDDLNVHSARLVDIILEMEDKFSVRIDDEESSSMTTVGGAVNLLMAKLAEQAAAA